MNLLRKGIAICLHLWTSRPVLTTLAVLAACTAIFMFIEWRQGRSWRRYFTRAVLTDLEYAIFYIGGFFAAIWYPLFRLFDYLVRTSGFQSFALLAPFHPAVHIVAFMVVTDFAEYWKHRWMHASPRLWPFHSIHHSQQTMTLLTSYRFHFVDEIFNNVIRFAIGLIVGIPAAAFLWLTALMTIYQSIQHSDLGWSFGPLDRILVSSRFHNVHHSAEPRHFLRNFGLLFSVWDLIFGTAVLRAERPARYGIDDPVVPPSFVSQFFFPWRRNRREAHAPEILVDAAYK